MWAITDVAILRNMDDDAAAAAGKSSSRSVNQARRHLTFLHFSALLSSRHSPLDLNVDTANSHWQAIKRELQALNYI